MKQPFFCLGMVIGLTMTIAGIGVSGAEQKIEAREFKGKDGHTMPYRILIPPDYDSGKKYPLVLCLHGAGGRGSDNTSRGSQAFASLSNAKVQKEYPAFLLTPQCPKDKKWANINWKKGSYSIETVKMSDELKTVLEILESVKKEFSIDPARIYVTGQSMGGYGTWDIILRNPQLFAAAIPVCGAGDPSQAEKISHLSLWVFHGDADTTVPVNGSRDMVEALKKVNGKIKYTEYPGCGHNSYVPAWSEKDIIPWLFQQKKD